MLIQGSFNPAHILREFLMCEYAFSVHWPEELSVRIAHRKGVWTLAKMVGDTVVDFFAVDDTWYYPNLYKQPSGLIRGFLSEKQENSFSDNQRMDIADALTDLLRFWAQGLEKITEINVLQPGRNASVSEEGRFDLAPRIDDWKK